MLRVRVFLYNLICRNRNVSDLAPFLRVNLVEDLIYQI